MSETSGLFCGKGCCLYCSTTSVRTGHRAYMYALYVCRICMPYTYAVYVCLMRMPYTHALYVCRICMPYSYAVYACLIRMPYLSLCVCFIRMPYTYAVYVCLIRMPYMYCRIPGIRAGQGAYGRASYTPNSTPTEQ